MTRKILKINRLRKNNDKLFNFLDPKRKYTGEDIRTWISDCIVHFTGLGVDQNIITYFLSRLEFETIERKREVRPWEVATYYNPGHSQVREVLEVETSIGPFIFDKESNRYIIGSGNILKKDISSPRMTAILVAFKVAENTINNIEDERSIIPRTLIEEFNTDSTQSIFLALKSVQENYDKKDIKSLIASIVTATELVCDLIPELSRCKKLEPKLKKIYDEKTIYEKYNIRRDTVWSLNNSRIIRNCNSHDPKDINHTSMYEAVGYVHILVLFIAALLASGEVKI